MIVLLDDEAPVQAQPRDRAAVLFPESEYLQREWRRAISTVRRTERGWVLDGTGPIVPRQDGTVLTKEPRRA